MINLHTTLKVKNVEKTNDPGAFDF